jgi:hypothetical protein
LTPLGSSLNIWINFLCLSSLILFPFFATHVVDTGGKITTGGKFTAGVVDVGGNLPPLSLTTAAIMQPLSTIPVVPVAKFTDGVIDIVGAP